MPDDPRQQIQKLLVTGDNRLKQGVAPAKVRESYEQALAVARENARRTDLAVDLLEWDLFSGLPVGPWDLVVSNPPYVRPDEIARLEPEVRGWEPRQALVGEGATDAVAGAACDVLRPGGALVLEVADGDAGRVGALLRVLGYDAVTVTKDLALVTWHSAGLQLFSTSDPARPTQLAAFVPEPLGSVATEDPALSSGPDQVVMWSYPIIQDGLIYVVDIRNGLYVLKYRGPNEGEVASTGFLEGNSNLSDGS